MPPTGPHGRPRMVDVGRLAHVSAQTVSRYFSGHGYVSADARVRIEEAVATLGYRPNPAARQLRTNRSDAIGIIAMGPSNFGIWTILNGMTAQARREGYTLVIGQLEIVEPSPSSPREIRASLEQLLAAGVDGLVFATPYQGGEHLIGDAGERTPLVVVSERPGSPDNSARADSYHAGLLAMRHLIGLGHRRILHVGGDPTTAESAERERSYRDALAEAGLTALEVEGRDWTPEWGYEIGARVDADSFTAVFAANDLIASGFMSALRERGRVAPDDYSIVGIDDMPEMRFFAPPLTSVSLDFAEVGRVAIGMLVERIRTGRSLAQRVVEPRLRVRASTGAPSA